MKTQLECGWCTTLKASRGYALMPEATLDRMQCILAWWFHSGEYNSVLSSIPSVRSQALLPYVDSV